MTEIPAIRDIGRRPTHPGAILLDVIEDSGISKTDAAKRIGISRQHLYDICNEKKPINPDVAARIGKSVGNGSGVWLRMQVAYDSWEADQSPDLEDVVSLVCVA